ncbi:MAG: hypothetical protein AAF657_30625 [Acidobacteriota bacterium]
MKKNQKKKLSLNRETLRVDSFLDRAVGGWRSSNCTPTDEIVTGAPASDCGNCTGGTIYTVNCGSGACTATC